MKNTNYLTIIQLDQNKQPIKEISINKPTSYEILKQNIYESFHLKFFSIYYNDGSGKELEIKDSNSLQKINDIIFVKEIKDLKQSIYDRIHDNLSESKIDIIDEKYLCNLRNEKLIDNPYFCYKCQKRFCEKCLKDLDKQKPLKCPFCGFEKQFQEWQTLKNFKEERKYHLEALEKMKKLEDENEKYNKKEMELLKQIKKLKVELQLQINKYNEEKKNHYELFQKYKQLEGDYKSLKTNYNDLAIKSNKLKDVFINLKNKALLNKMNKENEAKNEIYIHNINSIKGKGNILNMENDNSISIVYRIDKSQAKIKIFGWDFVFNNKNKCKIIINKIEYNISEFIEYEKYNVNKLDNFLSIDLTNINNITDMSYMFYNCSSLLSLPNISKINTKNISNMCFLFYNCSILISLPDISKWDTSKVTDMSSMFSGCHSLISLPDISGWNTKNVVNMVDMFLECLSLKSLPDISKWNTKKVKDMEGMFSGCSLLKSLPDISKWDISNVTNKSYMFYKCNPSLNIPHAFLD